jgi:hypothetical protein
MEPTQGKVTLDLDKAEEATLDRAVELAATVAEWLENLDSNPSLTAHHLKVNQGKVENLRTLALAMHEAVAGFKEAGRTLS